MTYKQSSLCMQCLLGQSFQAWIWGFLAAPLPCLYHPLFRLCSFPFPLRFSLSSVTIHYRNHTVAGFPSIFFFVVFVVGKFTASSLFTSLGRHRGITVQAAGGVCMSKQVTVFFFLLMFDYLSPVPAARSSQGWLNCWGGDVALRLVIRWVLLLIAYLLTLAV